jgi:hypothetical protein
VRIEFQGSYGRPALGNQEHSTNPELRSGRSPGLFGGLDQQAKDQPPPGNAPRDPFDPE